MEVKYSDLIFDQNVKLNSDSLNRCRVMSNIFSGISAGALCLSAGTGILYWIGINIVVTVLLFFRITVIGSDGKGANLFFQNPLQAVSGGILSNLMSYLLFWIMFYNVVYVV